MVEDPPDEWRRVLLQGLEKNSGKSALTNLTTGSRLESENLLF